MKLVLGIVPAPPYPWYHVKVRSLLLSAYYILNNQYQSFKLLQEFKQYNINLVLDSGGYQVLNRMLNSEYVNIDKLKYNLIKMFSIVMNTLVKNDLEIDYVLQIDIPPKVILDLKDDINYVMKLNFELYEITCKICDENRIKVVPIIHAPYEYAFNYYIRYLHDIASDIIALGGFVPYARTRPHLAATWIENLLDLIDCRRIHLLGLFMPNLLRKLRQLRDNRLIIIDYAGWRRAAALGLILTPWGYRKITDRGKRRNAPRPTEEELVYVQSLCKYVGIDINRVRRNFEDRAVFNIYAAMDLTGELARSLFYCVDDVNQ